MSDCAVETKAVEAEHVFIFNESILHCGHCISTCALPIGCHVCSILFLFLNIKFFCIALYPERPWLGYKKVH